MKRMKYEDLKKGMIVRVRMYRRRPPHMHWGQMYFCGQNVTISKKDSGCVYIKEETRSYGEKSLWNPCAFERANVWTGGERCAMKT